MKDIHGSQDWRALCELASKEQDSQKLLDLISKINRALEEMDRKARLDHAPIKIIHDVLLPVDRFEEAKCDLPAVNVPLALPMEYDC